MPDARRPAALARIDEDSRMKLRHKRLALARHDENCMPPEVADAIKQAQRGPSRLDSAVARQLTDEKQP